MDFICCCNAKSCIANGAFHGHPVTEQSSKHGKPTHDLSPSERTPKLLVSALIKGCLWIAANSPCDAGTRLSFLSHQVTLESRNAAAMARIKTPHRKYFLAAMGLCGICAAASPIEAATLPGMAGGLTAYEFDGIYKGDSQRTASNDASCPSGREVAVEVHNGRLRLPWNDRQVFDARIARDGSFFATSGASPVLAEKHMSIVPTLQGRIGTIGLVADYGTRWCRYRLEASRPARLQHLSQQDDAGTARQRTSPNP